MKMKKSLAIATLAITASMTPTSSYSNSPYPSLIPVETEEQREEDQCTVINGGYLFEGRSDFEYQIPLATKIISDEVERHTGINTQLFIGASKQRIRFVLNDEIIEMDGSTNMLGSAKYEKLILLSSSPELFTTIHEILHKLGLWHISEPSNIMYPYNDTQQKMIILNRNQAYTILATYGICLAQ